MSVLSLLHRYRPFYILARVARKGLPETIARRVLSRRTISVRQLYSGLGNCSWTYLNIIQQAGLTTWFAKSNGSVILETGTGFCNPASAPLLLCGIKNLILLEPYGGDSQDREHMAIRLKDLVQCAENDEAFPLPKIRTSAELFANSTASRGIPKCVEILQRFWEDTGLPDDSVDLILSTSVLEHLRAPEVVLDESLRILKPGGWMIHLVDLRDHFFRYPFEMLKYSPRMWKFLTTRCGGSGYQNRWRLPHWTAALDKRGFRTQLFPQTVLYEEMKKERPFFQPEFLGFSDEALATVVAILVSQK